MQIIKIFNKIKNMFSKDDKDKDNKLLIKQLMDTINSFNQNKRIDIDELIVSLVARQVYTNLTKDTKKLTEEVINKIPNLQKYQIKKLNSLQNDLNNEPYKIKSIDFFESFLLGFTTIKCEIALDLNVGSFRIPMHKVFTYESLQQVIIDLDKYQDLIPRTYDDVVGFSGFSIRHHYSYKGVEQTSYYRIETNNTVYSLDQFTEINKVLKQFIDDFPEVGY